MTTTPEVHPIVGVHQPNFFPWLGYFHKLRWSDTFVLLDDAQIKNSGGSVTNRTALVQNDKQLYFTAPIDRSKTLRIDEVPFAAGEDFRERFVTFLKHAYGKAPFMKELGEVIVAMVRDPAPTIGAYNAAAIRTLAAMLSLPATIVSSASLEVTTTSTARLVDLVARVGGRTYLAGAGAKNYQEDALFFARSINVYAREYAAPSYPRGRGAPVPGLSVLDALLFLGVDGTRALLDEPLDPALLTRASGAGMGPSGA